MIQLNPKEKCLLLKSVKVSVYTSAKLFVVHAVYDKDQRSQGYGEMHKSLRHGRTLTPVNAP